jgi:flagellar hook assembly protein FlgD
VSPPNGETLDNSRPEFEWEVLAEAEEYRIQIADNENFTTTEIDDSATSSTYIPPTDLADGLWYWRVAAEDSCGNEGTWSDQRMFTIDTRQLYAIHGTVGLNYTSENDSSNSVVKIKEENTTIETDSTDARGAYSITLGPGNYSVVATHVDYVKDSTDVTVVSGNWQIDFSLTRLGDMNGNGIVHVDDFMDVVNLILEKEDFTAQDSLVADMNEDGDVNVLDLVLLLIAILTEPENPKDQDSVELFDLVDVDLYADWVEDGIFGVSLGLSHGQEVGGLELWLRYDRSMYKIDDVELLSRQEGLDIAYRDNDGLVKVLIYGLGGMDVADGQAVCRIDLRPTDLTSSGNSGITVEKVIISDVGGSSLNYALNGTGEDGEIALVYPRAYQLHQNYPNPFNPSTTISYDIPDGQERVDVGLWIYDLRGRLVRKLVDTESLPGRYAVQWDGRSDRGERVSSGVYFYQIIAGDFVSTRKLVVIK